MTRSSQAQHRNAQSSRLQQQPRLTCRSLTALLKLAVPLQQGLCCQNHLQNVFMQAAAAGRGFSSPEACNHDVLVPGKQHFGV